MADQQDSNATHDAMVATTAKEDREAMEKLTGELLKLNAALKHMNEETKKLEAEIDRMEAGGEVAAVPPKT